MNESAFQFSGAPIPPRRTFDSFGEVPAYLAPRQAGPLGVRPPVKTNITGVANTTVTVSNNYSEVDDKEDLYLAPLFTLGKKRTGNKAFTLPQLNSLMLVKAQEKAHRAPRKFANGRCDNGYDEVFTDHEEFLKEITFGGIVKSMSHPNEGFTNNQTGLTELEITTQHRGVMHNMPNIWGADVLPGDNLVIVLKYVTHLPGKSVRRWNGTVVADREGGFQTLRLFPMICRDGVPIGLTGDESTQMASTCQKEVAITKADGTVTEVITVRKTVPAMVMPIGKAISTTGRPTQRNIDEAILSREGYRALRTQDAHITIHIDNKSQLKNFLTLF